MLTSPQWRPTGQCQNYSYAHTHTHINTHGDHRSELRRFGSTHAQALKSSAQALHPIRPYYLSILSHQYTNSHQNPPALDIKVPQHMAPHRHRHRESDAQRGRGSGGRDFCRIQMDQRLRHPQPASRTVLRLEAADIHTKTPPCDVCSMLLGNVTVEQRPIDTVLNGHGRPQRDPVPHPQGVQEKGREGEINPGPPSDDWVTLLVPLSKAVIHREITQRHHTQEHPTERTSSDCIQPILERLQREAVSVACQLM
mmetsp:Transcript_6094/g.17407  ORF Transcript_6094/g.17407 Transcript_6094/m.17407 type:complete len:254 (+) Transcript_6094:2905-3666(+)